MHKVTTMNWQVKALLQQAFSYIPFGEKLNYIGQRYIVRNLPHDEKQFLGRVTSARKHFENYRKYGLPVESPIFYEFGAGWDLIIPLTYWLMGIDHQILVDIRPLLRIELINDTLKRLYIRQHELPMISRTMKKPIRLHSGSAGELRELFGTLYIAPCDAQNVSTQEANSVDFISSTGVLEHVPAHDIVPVLSECKRLLKPGGIMSHRIGYHDHYAIVDPKISIYNFLKYSDIKWRLYNPPLHYQNRLRHKDYIAMIRDNTSLDIIDEIIEAPNPAQTKRLHQMSLAQKFRDNYTFDDLIIPAATIVLRKETD